MTAFYNHRGTAEPWIQESKNAVKWTWLSCRKFHNYEVWFQLHALALPKKVKHWSLTTIREKLVKIGAKVLAHGRYVTFQMAKVTVPRDLSESILRLIDDLRQSSPATA